MRYTSWRHIWNNYFYENWANSNYSTVWVNVSLMARARIRVWWCTVGIPAPAKLIRQQYKSKKWKHIHVDITIMNECLFFYVKKSLKFSNEIQYKIFAWIKRHTDLYVGKTIKSVSMYKLKRKKAPYTLR